MGTAISLDLADDLPAAILHELAEETFGWLREVDARFSAYRRDSEVCRLDRGELPLTEASADLRSVPTCGGRPTAASFAWLDRLPNGYLHAVITDDARLLHSGPLPRTP